MERVESTRTCVPTLRHYGHVTQWAAARHLSRSPNGSIPAADDEEETNRQDISITGDVHNQGATLGK